MSLAPTAEAAPNARQGAHAVSASAVHTPTAASGTGDTASARKASGPGYMLVVTGPSGAGKGTLVSHLLKIRPGCVFSISATTRARRATEAQGREYEFL